MKIKKLLFHLAYYVLVLLAYMLFNFCTAALCPSGSLGAIKAFLYGVMFVATPAYIVVCARFSLLKWYVDPFMAAEIPLYYYLGSILTQMERTGASFFDAMAEYNASLVKDSVMLWYIIGLFLFGLAASFSLARKRGESISYRLFSKFLS